MRPPPLFLSLSLFPSFSFPSRGPDRPSRVSIALVRIFSFLSRCWRRHREVGTRVCDARSDRSAPYFRNAVFSRDSNYARSIRSNAYVTSGFQERGLHLCLRFHATEARPSYIYARATSKNNGRRRRWSVWPASRLLFTGKGKQNDPPRSLLHSASDNRACSARASEGQRGMSKYRSPRCCTCPDPDRAERFSRPSGVFPPSRGPILRTRRFEDPKVTPRRWPGKSK